MKDRFDKEIALGDVVLLLSSKGTEGYGVVAEIKKSAIKVYQYKGNYNGKTFYRTIRKTSEGLVIVLTGHQESYVINNCYPFEKKASGLHYADYLKEYNEYLNTLRSS